MNKKKNELIARLLEYFVFFSYITQLQDKTIENAKAPPFDSIENVRIVFEYSEKI